MDLGLSDSVAVVFGAARGIGAAIVHTFIAEGASVAAIDQDPGVHDLSVPTGSFVSLTADVTDYGSVRQIGVEVAERLGCLDHVVFAVGIGSGKFGFPFWKLEPADWSVVLKVNLIGAVNVAHVFAPSLVNTASHGVRSGTAGGPVKHSVSACEGTRFAALTCRRAAASWPRR